MGWYVHLSVIFAADSNEGVAALAAKHLPGISGNGDGCREARWFLESLSERTGRNYGPKGGLSTWGIVGNYTRGEVFVDSLKPFFSELLSGEVDGGPCSHERVIVFCEQEQSERAMAYEIFRADEMDSESLTVREHKCPFAWMQM